jgi:protoheme ferro-lyase
MSARPRHHVVLVTYGEPPTPSFVDQLAYSWRILLGLTRKVDAIPRPVLPLIALSRARSRRQLWRQYRYGSPLEPITGRQARCLGDALAAAEPGVDWRMHVAYEYRPPLLADFVATLAAGEPITVVPLYAAESAFTHALSREACEVHRDRVTVLGALPLDVLADASAAHVLAATEDGGWRGPGVALVLAAHGTVLEPKTPIQTGREPTEALCSAIRTRLSGHFGLVINGWLNHTRGGRWTEPAMDQALAQVVAAGFSRVVYYPYGFLADNAETELEGRVFLEAVAAEHHGFQSRHLACLNESPLLMEPLARGVLGRGAAGASPRADVA